MKDIPVPQGNWLVWANSIVAWLRTLQAEISTPGPKVIQLEHKKASAAATKNGILMWEPVSKQVVVSKDGAWYALTMGTVPVTTGIS